MRVIAPMGGERIEAEVAVGPAPHRMRMVGIALCVVVFHQQVGPLYPVVVRSPLCPRTCPAEVDTVKRLRGSRQHASGARDS